MNLLHVIPQFPYFGERTVVGGYASALLNLALAQVRQGDRVTIVGYVQGRAGDFTIEDGVRVHSPFAKARPGRPGFVWRFAGAARRWAAARRGEFDLLHVHSGFAEYLLMSGHLRRALRLPALHTLYCPIPARGGRCRWPLVRSVLRRDAASLGAIVAISENVARSLRAYGVDAETIRHVPMAVDLERYRPAVSVNGSRDALSLAPDDVAVLFVGNAKPQKNLAGLIEAVHRVRGRHGNVRLVVTTELKRSSSDQALAALRRRVDELGLGPCLVERGIVDDMPRLMQACDVLAAPFLDTHGPSDHFMAVLEAMACAKPTVVSRVGGMPEVIDESVGRLVDPHRPDSIAAALEEYLGDAEARRRAGDLARRRVEADFDPAAIAARYRALYTDLLS